MVVGMKVVNIAAILIGNRYDGKQLMVIGMKVISISVTGMIYQSV